MNKISEKEFIEGVKQLLEEKGFVKSADCHFGEDNDELPDVKLALNAKHWPNFPNYLLLEAKSHHSTDSPNTINKIFGQLLKETGKAPKVIPKGATFCLGILILEDACEWVASEGQPSQKKHIRGSGIEYYQQGFLRIPADKYQQFGELVDARYVLAYSHLHQRVKVFGWNEFYHHEEPILILP